MRSLRFLLLLTIALAAQSARALPPAHVVPAAADAVVACQTGDTVEVSGAFAMTRDFDTCLFQADGATLVSRGPSAVTDQYQFQWAAASAGEHLLQVVYTEQSGRKTTGRRLIVLVTDNPPVVFKSLPSSAGADTPVTVAGTDAFAAARVSFFFDGAMVTTAMTAPFTATLPIAAKKEGSYPFRVVAYDTVGRVFYSRTATIEVPPRIKVNAPASFSLQKPDDKAALIADILPDVNAAKVAYSWAASGSDDWKPLADVSSAPYSTAFDLSTFASGDYQVKATLTTASGGTYESAPTPLTFHNVVADDKAAQEAKAKADAEAAAQAEAAKKQASAQASVADAAHVQAEKAANLARFLPRPGYDEKVFRQQIAELALSPANTPSVSDRRGAVGMAEGLIALPAGNGATQAVGRGGETAPARGRQRPWPQKSSSR